MIFNCKNKAFTLIELLVVIAIIGILSSVVLASLSNARSNARDSSRIQHVDQIQTALEMYYNDNGQYPPIQHAFTGNDENSGGNCGHNENWCDLENALSDYIDSLPKNEPLDDTYHYMYFSAQGDGYGTYGLAAELENDNNGIGLNDGGFYPSSENPENSGREDMNAYEVGPTVQYCLQNYSGDNADWFWKDGNWNTVCEGGN